MGYVFGRPVYYQGRVYRPGFHVPDEAPADLVTAWQESGSVVPETDEEGGGDAPVSHPKARRVSAPSGRDGIAAPSHGPDVDLVGQVPPPEKRGAAPAPRKRPGKKANG